ncbi:hypothetical protein BH23ACT7_BH23ACT7_21940 [soil metagenome]|jgi:hypothetical protein
MQQAPVGQKCPSCARLPRRARALGKPVHYVRGIGAGVAAAVAGGVAFAVLLRLLPFGTLILSGFLGFGIGRAVGWGVHRQTQPPFPGIAAACGVLGVLVAFALLGRVVPSGLFLLLAYPVAGLFAVRGLQR